MVSANFTISSYFLTISRLISRLISHLVYDLYSGLAREHTIHYDYIVGSCHTHVAARLICTTELTDLTYAPSTLCPRGEATIASAIEKAAVIYGDPLLSYATSHGVRAFNPDRAIWHDCAHLAMSGRMFF